MLSGVMQHSEDRHTMDSPNVSKMIWSTTTSRTPLQDSKNSSKLSMHDTGNEKENSPMKPEFLDLLETSPNRSLTLTGLTTSPAKVLQLPSRRSPPFPTFLRNLGKMESKHHRNVSAVLIIRFASYVALLDTLPRTVQNPA